MKKLALTLIIPVFLAASACTTDIGANQYSSSSVGSVNRTSKCSVISVRQVTVRDDDRSTGTAVGSIAGGLAGSQVGRGATSTILGAVGGSIIGGAAGNAAQRGLSSQTAYEYVIRLDSGNVVTITQGTDVLLGVGQRCILLYGSGADRARIIPFDGM